MKTHEQKAVLTSNQAGTTQPGKVTQRFENNRSSFSSHLKLQSAIDKKSEPVKQLISGISAKYKLNNAPIQRMIKWSNAGKIEDIRIDRPAGSAIGHHTSAYLLFIEAIQNNIIGSDCEGAIKKIKSMAKDLKSYPGYDASDKKMEKAVDGVIAQANEDLDDFKNGKLSQMNYTYAIENLSLLFLDARNRLNYTVHDNGWGSKGGKQEATHIRKFSKAFQEFDETSYKPKELANLASLTVDLADTDSVVIDDKQDFNTFANILDQHFISQIVAHPTLENIQVPLANAIAKELKKRKFFHSKIKSKKAGKKSVKITREYDDKSKKYKRKVATRLGAINGWKKLAKH